MSDEQTNGPVQRQDHDSTGWVLLGAVLIVAGVFLAAQTLGLLPWPLREVWRVVREARFGLGIIVIGVALIMWASSARHAVGPRQTGRLYRARDDKWIAGVLGGLARHFGADPTLLRLAFIALVVLLDIGALVAVYIVMAIVVPSEPRPDAAVPAPPAWPESAPYVAPPATPAPSAGPPATPAPDDASAGGQG